MTSTQTLQHELPRTYFRKSVCFVKCQPLSSAIVYQLFTAHFGALRRNSLNQLCLSARHHVNGTLQQQIPLRQHKNHLTACITARLCQPLLGHGIWRNKQLIITRQNAFLSAFLSVWGMTFSTVWREGGAIRINYRLLPLSKKSRWWLWQRCVWFSPDVFFTHTHTSSAPRTGTGGYSYCRLLGRHVLDVNETE